MKRAVFSFALGLVVASFGCKKKEAEPDHPIQRVEIAIVSTPPFPATVPAMVRPGEAVTPIQLTAGVAVAVKLQIFQDGNAVEGLVQQADYKIATVHKRTGGFVFTGETPGNTTFIVSAPRAYKTLEIPVTVKDQ